MQKSLKAVILAAGRGSRMKAATRDAPKCLARLAGKTLLEWQISALEEAGIEDITVVSGYRSSKLRPFLYGALSVVRNRRWATTNILYSLSMARDTLLAGDCIVSYSDLVYHPDSVKLLAECDEDVCVTYDTLWLDLWAMRFEDPLSDAETFVASGGHIMEIGSKPETIAEIEGQYMGLLKIRPSGWRKIEKLLSKETEKTFGKMDMTSLLKRLIVEGVRIGAVAVDGRWLEVDSLSDLELYEKKLAGKTAFAHDWRW